MDSRVVWILGILSTICGSYALKDGNLYRFSSVTDEHVITISSADSGNNNITIEPWQEGANQKWLAVQAIMSSDSYILLSKRQSWDWNKFAKVTTTDRRDFLPDNTMVLGEDAASGAIKQQEFNGKKPQQWKSVDVSQGKSLIKSLNDDKCLYNPGQPKDTTGVLTKLKQSFQGLVGNKKEKVHPKVFLLSKECNPAEEKQLWLITIVS